MSLTSGTRLGPYEILAPLGAGGMGEVYRARDSRLDRIVAIKVLPDAFGGDPERLARFEREARLLASLSHPNIAVLHGLESDGARRFITMEFVEGVSLAERLRAGAMPVDEAIDVARQVATALEAAHEGGVVHRDLKPGNVMLTPAGVAKVLDFGLAKGAAGSASDTSISMSPTLTFATAADGVILGTAAYMSPEQARGKPVDRRTDIWAFGCVLYECLTGRQTFEGETVSDLIASILKGEIDWAALPTETPQHVRDLLRRCLERDARQRLRDIGEARLVLEQRHAIGTPATAATAAPTRAGLPAIIAIGGALVLAALAALGAWALKPVPRTPSTWAELIPPAAMRFATGMGGHEAVSRNGRWLVTAVVDSAGTRRLCVRDLETGGVRVLAGTEDASYPFWSPDARSLGFFVPGKLMRLDLESGAAFMLTPAPDGRGGDWNRDQNIVFAPSSSGGLSVVSANGGGVRVLVPDSSRDSHRFPHILPDERHFVVGRYDSTLGFTLEVRSMDGGTPRPLPVGKNVMANAYFMEGHLFYCEDFVLRARPFDPSRMRFTGDAVTVSTPVNMVPPRGRGGFSAGGEGGTLVFSPGRAQGQDRLVERDRTGRVVRSIDPKGGLEDLCLSPDGNRLLWSQRSTSGGADRDVWIHDLARGTSVRMTFTGENDDAVWSPDGKRMAWACPDGIRTRDASGAGNESSVLQSKADMTPSQWTPDGRTLLFTTGSTGQNIRDTVWALDLTTGVATEVLKGEAGNTRHAQVSPDGRWIAFTSQQSNRPEVYVMDYPGLKGRWQVSTQGGKAPRWRRDGAELLFLDIDSQVVAVTVAAAESSLVLGLPTVLFKTDMGMHALNRAHSWDVDATGKRFFMLEPLQQADERPPLILVRGWRAPTRSK